MTNDLKKLLRRSYTVKVPFGTEYKVARLPYTPGSALQSEMPYVVLCESKNPIKEKAFVAQVEAGAPATLVRYLLTKNQTLKTGEIIAAEVELAPTLRNCVESTLRTVVKSDSNLHLAPGIPASKLEEASKSYAAGVQPDRVVALYDDTVFGSATDGFLLTDSSLYYNAGDLRFTVPLSHIVSHGIEPLAVVKGGKTTFRPTLVIRLADGSTVEVPQGCACLTIEGLDRLLAAICEARNAGLIKESDGFVIVEDMPNTVKTAYLKALVWIAHAYDGTINNQELSELQILMTQVKSDPQVRQSVREAIMKADRLNPDALVRAIVEEAPSGSERVLGLSLLKDAIRLHRAVRKTSALTVPTICKLAALAQVNAEQLAFIESACVQDEKLLSGEISDEQIIAMAKDMAGRASAVGVPIAAVYLSGSVTGLSAAGITSGLATLGLGGVLGLSSMVTGIGVLVLLGVGVYTGVQWLMGSSSRDKLSRRELMLQEVLRTHHEAIANLAEDIAAFGQRVMDLTADLETNKVLIRKLAREMSIFAGAMSELRSREGSFEADLRKETKQVTHVAALAAPA